jgi:CelD/BcsL family acetyltransferase involved in cellulose biosynthesis
MERMAEIEPLAREWDELADRADAPPWLRPGWVAAWWEAFGKGTLEILCLRRDGEVVAVLPLHRRYGALGSVTNWHSPGFGVLAADDEAARELAAGLLGSRPRRLSLAFLDPDRRDVEAFRAAGGGFGYRLIVRPYQRSPYIDLSGTWADYERSRSSDRVREIHRRRRRLQELGPVSVDVEEGSTHLEKLLEEGFRVEASGWKGSRGTAILSRPETRRFYEEVARWAARRGTLRLAFLRVDGRPVAFHYNLVEGGMLYHLKEGYDQEFRRFGPGPMLHHVMLERAFEEGLRSYELLGTEEPWKMEWADRVRELLLLQAFAPSPSGLLDWTAFAYGRPVAKRAMAVFRR